MAATQLSRVDGSRPATGVGTPADLDPRRFDEAEAIPAVFNGAVLSDLSVPASVAVGETINLSGRVTYDCPLCLTSNEVRVIATTDSGQERIDNVGEMSGIGVGGGIGAPHSTRWSISLPAPETETNLTVRLKAQSFGRAWGTTDTAGPFDVNVVSPGEQAVNDAIGFVPWVVGGGAVGVGAARLTDRRQTAGAVAGVGAGVVGKALADRAEFLDLPQAPDVPVVPILAVAALLGTGAVFLSVSGTGQLSRAASRAASRVA